MTDLQVKYQQMLETERANRAREEIQSKEAAVKQQEADAKTLETELKEKKVPYEIQNILMNSQLTMTEKYKVVQEIFNLQEQVHKIRADTALSEAEKQLALNRSSAQFIQNYKDTKLLPQQWFDGLLNWLAKIFSGAGKSLIEN